MLTNREPKATDKFRVTFPEKFNFDDLTLFSISTPCWRRNEETIHDIDTEVHYPISGKWDNFTMELIDYVSPSTSQILFDWTNSDFINQPFVFTIGILDPVGDVISRWEIHAKSIISIKFGKLDYSSSQILKILVEIETDYCKLLY